MNNKSNATGLKHGQEASQMVQAAEEEEAKFKDLPPIVDSLGWGFPQIKLASWDPENKKQWRKVRIELASSCLVYQEY